jgi:hypothetical protein
MISGYRNPLFQATDKDKDKKLSNLILWFVGTVIVSGVVPIGFSSMGFVDKLGFEKINEFLQRNEILIFSLTMVASAATTSISKISFSSQTRQSIYVFAVVLWVAIVFFVYFGFSKPEPISQLPLGMTLLGLQLTVVVISILFSAYIEYSKN